MRKALPAYTYSHSGGSWEWRYINLTPRPLLPLPRLTSYLIAHSIYWQQVGKVWKRGWIIMFILHCGLYDLARNSQFLTAVWYSRWLQWNLLWIFPTVVTLWYWTKNSSQVWFSILYDVLCPSEASPTRMQLDETTGLLLLTTLILKIGFCLPQWILLHTLIFTRNMLHIWSLVLTASYISQTNTLLQR